MQSPELLSEPHGSPVLVGDVRSEITCTLGSYSWPLQVLRSKAPLMLSPGPAVPWGLVLSLSSSACGSSWS